MKISYHYLDHHYLYFYFLFSHINNPGGYPHGWGFEITLIHTPLDRTPLEEWSDRSRDLYRTKHSTLKKQISMPPTGLEPAIPVSERPKTHIVDGAATILTYCCLIISGYNYRSPESVVYQSFVKRPVIHTSRHPRFSTSPMCIYCIYSSLIYVGMD